MALLEHYHILGKHHLPAVPTQEVVKDYDKNYKKMFHLTVGYDDFSNMAVIQNLKR